MAKSRKKTAARGDVAAPTTRHSGIRSAHDRVLKALRGQGIRMNAAATKEVTVVAVPRPHVCALSLATEPDPDQSGFACHFELISPVEADTLIVDLKRTAENFDPTTKMADAQRGKCFVFLVNQFLGSRVDSIKALWLVVIAPTEAEAKRLADAHSLRIDTTPVRTRVERWFPALHDGAAAWLLYGEVDKVGTPKALIAWTLYGESEYGPVAELLREALSDSRRGKTPTADPAKIYCDERSQPQDPAPAADEDLDPVE